MRRRIWPWLLAHQLLDASEVQRGTENRALGHIDFCVTGRRRQADVQPALGNPGEL